MEWAEDHTSEGADESCIKRNVGDCTEADEDPEELLTEWDAGETGESAGALEVDGPGQKNSVIESSGRTDCHKFRCSSFYGSITSSTPS